MPDIAVQADEVTIVDPRDLPVISNLNASTFLGYWNNNGVFESGRIDFNSMTPLFGVTSEKGNSQALAISQSAFTDEVNAIRSVKADKTNPEGDQVVYAPNGEIDLPGNLVTFTTQSSIDQSTFEKKYNISLDTNGQQAGSLSGSIVIWRGQLPSNSDIMLRVPGTTDWKTSIFIHNSTDTTPVLKINCEDAIIQDGFKNLTFSTTSEVLYLTMYLKIKYAPDNINFDISNTLEILKASNSAQNIVIGADNIPIEKLNNTLYVENHSNTVNWSTTQTRNGALESDGNWVASAVVSKILWRQRLKPNTLYNIKFSPISSDLQLYFHNSTENGAASVKKVIPPGSSEYIFKTDSTNIYLTTYLLLIFPPDNIDYSIQDSLVIIEDYVEPDIIIDGSKYKKSQIINPANTGDSIYYNVKDFGAQGDGVTDDTSSIQQAMDYIIDSGGGTLFFPKGIYILDSIKTMHNVTGQLIIKPKGEWLKKHDWTQIRLVGEATHTSASTYATHSGGDSSVSVWENGTVLKSTYAGDILGANASPQAVLTAGAIKEFHGYWNSNLIEIENIAIQVKTQENEFPRLIGINMACAESLRVKNVLVYGSIPNVLQTAPSKANHYNAGFIFPKISCAPEQYYEGVYVKGGFRYGMIFSEHAQGTNLSCWDCETAYTFSNMHHSSVFGRLHAQNCKNIIGSLDVNFGYHQVGISYLNIQQVGCETNSGQQPIDFNYQNFVYDPVNRLKGSFQYHCVASNVGADNSRFVKDGGENLIVSPSF